MTAEPLVFNPRDPAYLDDPHAMHARMRAEDPIYRWEQGGMWILSRYDDVVAALKDSRLTTNVQAWSHYEDSEAIPEEVKRYSAKGLFQLDNTGHARVRKLVSPVFTPRRAAKREPLVAEVVNELLDAAEVEQRGEIDLVPALADPMPLQVIRRILGIGPQYDEQFRAWATDTITMTFPGLVGPEQFVAAAQRVPNGYVLMREILAERRANPADDLLSAMIHARDEDDRLDEEELVSMVSGLIVAGSETTVHLMGRSVINLIRYPEVQARVRADPSLLPGFIEEVLRHDGIFAAGLFRYALEDVEMGGKTIAKGDMVQLLTMSAMRDEATFAEPERFDIERDGIANISFGRGPHFCLGAHLARTEARVALEILLSRFPVMEAAGEPAYAPHPLIRALSTLPVRLMPAA